jgi:hypothetical protein
MLFVHPSKGGRLTTTSPSHPITLKTSSKIWMQIGFMIKNDIFMKAMISKNMIKNNLDVFSPIIILLEKVN